MVNAMNAVPASGQAAPTPEQAAFDAFWASPALGGEPASPLERESPGIRAAWKAAAQAAIRALQADNAAAVLTEPDALDELAKRDEAHARIVELAAHATSLAEDLDDAGETIADYREALTVMQRDRDAARAAYTAACSALRNIALGIAGDPAVAADHALMATHEIAPRDAGAASDLDAAQAAWTAYWDDPAEGEQHAWDMLPPDAKAAWGRAAEAAYPVLATQLADTQGERDHLAAALSGENEGVRLWMLDCGNLVDKHRKDAERLQAELDAARAALKAADAHNGRLRADLEALRKNLDYRRQRAALDPAAAASTEGAGG